MTAGLPGQVMWVKVQSLLHPPLRLRMLYAEGCLWSDAVAVYERFRSAQGLTVSAPLVVTLYPPDGSVARRVLDTDGTTIPANNIFDIHCLPDEAPEL